MIPKDAGKPDDLRRGRGTGKRKEGRIDVYPQLEAFLEVADAGSFNKATVASERDIA